jgi:RNA polymerase sigma-70 factor (ECF subfamily)
VIAWPSVTVPRAGAALEPEARTPEVFEAARAGDPAAFAEVYRRFAPVVHGIVLSRVGATDAEDLVQETFWIVHRRIRRLRDALALPGWVCAVARNLAIDHLRKRRRRPAPRPLAEDALPGPDAPSEGRELRDRALALLARLPDAYRETLVLRLAEGLTGPEIAERTGMTPGSVRVNLCRGMALLRPLLREEGWP